MDALIVVLVAVSVNLPGRDVWSPVLNYLRFTSLFLLSQILLRFDIPFCLFPVLWYWGFHPRIPLKLTSWSWWLLIVLFVDFSIDSFTDTLPFRQILQWPPLKKGSVIWISLKVFAMSMDAKTSFSFSAIAFFYLSAPFTSLCFRLLDTLASFLILMYLKKKTTKPHHGTQTPLQVISQTFLACLIAFLHSVCRGLFSLLLSSWRHQLQFFEELLQITSYIGS